MKRNNNTVKESRHKRTKKGKSKYAAKVVSGQMYGPGCCAHRLQVTPAQMAERRKANNVFEHRWFNERKPAESEAAIIARLEEKYG